jgi:hypothetical protein
LINKFIKFNKLIFIMKKFLLSTLLLALTLNVWSQITEPLTSGSLPSGWSQTSVTFSTSAGGFANFTSTSAVLTSPLLTVSAGATISFDVAKFGTGADGPLTVQVSNNGGTTWTAQTFDSPTPTDSDYLTSGPTALTVTGTNIRIRWIRSGSSSQKRLRNISITSTVLPIELTSFQVKVAATPVLTFTTATERNNAYFLVERSADGRNFKEIGKINGAGESNSTKEYTFTDAKPFKGVNYYRLKQVDFDGKFEYSKVISVVFGKTGGVRVFPTVDVADAIQVQFDEPTEEASAWQVIDATGRIIANGTFEAEISEYAVPVAQLPAGAYFLRLTTGRTVTTEAFRK